MGRVDTEAVKIFGMRISDSVAWAHVPATAYMEDFMKNPSRCLNMLVNILRI